MQLANNIGVTHLANIFGKPIKSKINTGGDLLIESDPFDESLQKEIKGVEDDLDAIWDNVEFRKFCLDGLQKVCKNATGSNALQCKVLIEYAKKKYGLSKIMKFMPQESLLLKHNNWLSNDDIDRILTLFSQAVCAFTWLPTVTSDFMYCTILLPGQSYLKSNSQGPAAYKQEINQLSEHMDKVLMQNQGDIIGNLLKYERRNFNYMQHEININRIGACTNSRIIQHYGDDSRRYAQDFHMLFDPTKMNPDDIPTTLTSDHYNKQIIEVKYQKDKTAQLLEQIENDIDAEMFLPEQWKEVNNFIKNDDYHETGKIIGMVINTDHCKSSGQHWITLTINKDTNEIYLFNSTDFAEYRHVLMRLRCICVVWALRMSQVTKQPVKITIWGTGLQTLAYTCGLFSVLFILSTALGNTIDETCNIFSQYEKDEIPQLAQQLLFQKD